MRRKNRIVVSRPDLARVLAILDSHSKWPHRRIHHLELRKALEQAQIVAAEEVAVDVVTLDSDVRTSLPVVLSGRKDTVLDIDQEELKAVVSLKVAAPGQKEVVVHPRVQPLPQGVTASLSDLKVHLVPLNVPKVKKKKRSSQ